MFPARYFPVPEASVGDHIGLVDAVSAEAVLARTTIHTATFSDLGPAASLAVNLAEGTGGTASRTDVRLDEFLAAAGRGLACTYRIAVRVTNVDDDVYRARVLVRGRALEPRYRMRYLSASERWARDARAVLRSPGRAKDVPITASLVPVAARGGRWQVQVQVAVDPDELVLLPSEAGKRGNWEVGALLADEKARRSWEWLGVSEVRKSGDEGATVVLHEALVDSLAPGSYECPT